MLGGQITVSLIHKCVGESPSIMISLQVLFLLPEDLWLAVIRVRNNVPGGSVCPQESVRIR